MFIPLGGARVYLLLAAVVAVVVAAAGVALLWNGYGKARAEIGELRAELAQEREQAAQAEAAFADYRREVKARVIEVEKVNVKRETVYVETKGVQEIIVREVPAAVAGYPELPPALRVLHDRAASRCGQEAPASSDGRDAAPVGLEEFASTVVENYCACERNRQQVIRLQEALRKAAEDRGE